MYEASSFSVHCGCFLLDHMELVENYLQSTAEGKRYLEQEMRALGLPADPGYANFLLFRMPDNDLKNRIVRNLADQDILISGAFGAPLHDRIRITLGPLKQMERVVNAIRLTIHG